MSDTGPDPDPDPEPGQRRTQRRGLTWGGPGADAGAGECHLPDGYQTVPSTERDIKLHPS